MSKKIKRAIEAIAEQLQTVMKREVTDIIAIGDLLLEAKEHFLEHGEWLPWLQENFGSSIRTAENYMAAARFASQFRNVANLKLRPTALYRLGRELDAPIGFYNIIAVKAILKAAESEWINAERAFEIADALRPKPKWEPLKSLDEIDAEMAAVAKADADVDDILEGPPPELPSAPEVTVEDVILPAFDRAVATLAQLQTKPLASFVGTTHAPDQIRAVSHFLCEAADAIDKRKAAG